MHLIVKNKEMEKIIDFDKLKETMGDFNKNVGAVPTLKQDVIDSILCDNNQKSRLEEIGVLDEIKHNTHKVVWKDFLFGFISAVCSMLFVEHLGDIWNFIISFF